MSGWIKTHRAIQSHWIFSDPERFRAWMIILFTVNFESKKQIIEGELIDCNRGQSILSLKSWADKFGRKWSIQKVRTFFDLLKKDNMITTEGLRKTTRLTVCNYESYQDDQHGDNTQITHRQQGDNNQITTTKECKELKNEEEVIIAEDKSSTKKIRKVSDFEEWIQNLAKWFFNTIEKNARDKLTEKQVIKWLDTFEKCNRIDHYSPEEIVEITKWARTDDFWKSNFQSPVKLRKKKDDVMYISVFKEKMQSKTSIGSAINRTENLKKNTVEAARLLGLT